MTCMWIIMMSLKQFFLNKILMIYIFFLMTNHVIFDILFEEFSNLCFLFFWTILNKRFFVFSCFFTFFTSLFVVVLISVSTDGDPYSLRKRISFLKSLKHNTQIRNKWIEVFFFSKQFSNFVKIFLQFSWKETFTKHTRFHFCWKIKCVIIFWFDFFQYWRFY